MTHTTTPRPDPLPDPEQPDPLAQEIAALVEHERRRGTSDEQIKRQITQHRKRVIKQ